MIGLCAYGVFRGENKSIVHELTGTSGINRDTIHELSLAQSQQISSSNRPNTPLLLKMSNTSHTAPDASLVLMNSQCFKPLDVKLGLYPVYWDVDTQVKSDPAVTDTLLRGTSGIFKHSVFSSSNCAVDNKGKRSMHRKGSRSQWSLAPLQHAVTISGHISGPDHSVVRNAHSATR